MQPFNPVYPNCFDMLTTHGVIADDLVGYVTGYPSPYLQNYVAQRGGWNPGLPGRVLPDPLPGVPPMPPLPQNDVYQPTPQQQSPVISPELPNKKMHSSTWKKIGLAILLSIGASLGIAKTGRLIKGTPLPPFPAGTPWYKKILPYFKF